MLTDLEAAAIGDILKHQPCTAHFIRTCFRNSPANHFSDSAGSVYPMMKRLENRGLLESRLQQDGQRQVRYYSCTDAGRTALRKWLGPPIGDDVTLAIDPIRTRILYLYRLSKTQRLKWFAEVEQSLRHKLSVVQAQLADRDPALVDALYLDLADENAIAELRSRLKWLAQAKARLLSNGHL